MEDLDDPKGAAAAAAAHSDMNNVPPSKPLPSSPGRRSNRQQKQRRSYSPSLSADPQKAAKRRKAAPAKRPEMERLYDKLPNGKPFCCDLCRSPYVCKPSRKSWPGNMSRHMPYPRYRTHPKTGQTLMLCNACGLAFSRPKKKLKSTCKSADVIQDEKEKYLKEAKDFGDQLVQQLNDPLADRIYCPKFVNKPCGCIQSYILREKAGTNNTETVTHRARQLLEILKTAKKLAGLKFYETIVDDGGTGQRRTLRKRGTIGLGYGHRRHKIFEDYVLETRHRLKEGEELEDKWCLCEYACQRLLCYSNNFLHKKVKTMDGVKRVPKMYGKSLKPVNELPREWCCGDQCTRIAISHGTLLQRWRDEAQEGQASARRALAEMLTPARGDRPNCYRFISMVTGCSSSTIARVNDQMKETGGDREPPDHGLKKYWQNKAKEPKKKKGKPVIEGGEQASQSLLGQELLPEPENKSFAMQLGLAPKVIVQNLEQCHIINPNIHSFSRSVGAVNLSTQGQAVVVSGDGLSNSVLGNVEHVFNVPVGDTTCITGLMGETLVTGEVLPCYNDVVPLKQRISSTVRDKPMVSKNGSSGKDVCETVSCCSSGNDTVSVNVLSTGGGTVSQVVEDSPQTQPHGTCHKDNGAAESGTVVRGNNSIEVVTVDPVHFIPKTMSSRSGKGEEQVSGCVQSTSFIPQPVFQYQKRQQVLSSDPCHANVRLMSPQLVVPPGTTVQYISAQPGSHVIAAHDGNSGIQYINPQQGYNLIAGPNGCVQLAAQGNTGSQPAVFKILDSSEKGVCLSKETLAVSPQTGTKTDCVGSDKRLINVNQFSTSVSNHAAQEKSKLVVVNLPNGNLPGPTACGITSADAGKVMTSPTGHLSSDLTAVETGEKDAMGNIGCKNVVTDSITSNTRETSSQVVYETNHGVGSLSEKEPMAKNNSVITSVSSSSGNSDISKKTHMELAMLLMTSPEKLDLSASNSVLKYDNKSPKSRLNNVQMSRPSLTGVQVVTVPGCSVKFPPTKKNLTNSTDQFPTPLGLAGSPQVVSPLKVQVAPAFNSGVSQMTPVCGTVVYPTNSTLKNIHLVSVGNNVQLIPKLAPSGGVAKHPPQSRPPKYSSTDMTESAQKKVKGLIN